MFQRLGRRWSVVLPLLATSMLTPLLALRYVGHLERLSAIPTCTRETCRLSALTAARISSHRLTIFCLWDLPLEVVAQSLIRFRRPHCLLQSMVKLGARRCIWLKYSLPWSAIAMASPAASRPALRRYAGTLTKPHHASPAWDKNPAEAGLCHPRQGFFHRTRSRQGPLNPILVLHHAYRQLEQLQSGRFPSLDGRGHSGSRVGRQICCQTLPASNRRLALCLRRNPGGD